MVYDTFSTFLDHPKASLALDESQWSKWLPDSDTLGACSAAVGQINQIPTEAIPLGSGFLYIPLITHLLLTIPKDVEQL
jgi:hypothetical protein